MGGIASIDVSCSLGRLPGGGGETREIGQFVDQEGKGEITPPDVDAFRRVIGADPELGREIVSLCRLADFGHEASLDHAARGAVDGGDGIGKSGVFELEKCGEENGLLCGKGEL